MTPYEKLVSVIDDLHRLQIEMIKREKEIARLKAELEHLKGERK